MHKISYLNEEMAKKIIEKNSSRKDGLLSLMLFNLKQLTPEAAQVLSSYTAGIGLPWTAVKNNPRALKHLLHHQYDTVFFNVGSLDEEIGNAFQESA